MSSAVDERGNTGYGRGLPDDEIILCGKSGGLEVRVPVETGSFVGEVGAFPRIILFGDIGGVRVWSEGTGDFHLKS